MDLLWQCTGSLLVIAALCLPPLFWIYIAVPKRPKRTNPITRDLLRPPGYTLSLKVRDLYEEFVPTFAILMTTPFAIFSVHAVLTKHFPFPYGNIDHVVVSSSGVYCVNTKTYGKLPDNSGDANVVVDYTEGVMRFPDRRVTIPRDQLASESKWLSQELTKATGFQVQAESMLAIPGWFVKDRIARKPTDPCILNPLNSKLFFVQARTVLSEQQIQQIAHQLDQLCRDIEVSFKNKPRPWSDTDS